MQQPHTRLKLKKELYKLAVARSDIAHAQKTCRIILERVSGMSDELYAPLFHAAVVAYGRPFVDNKSTGVLSRHWSDFKDPRHKRTHTALLKTRHEIVAHSDSSVRELGIVPPGVPVVDGAKASDYVGFKIATYYYPQQKFVDTYDTCSDLIGRFNARLDELTGTLYEGLQLPNAIFPLRFDNGL